jgi:hypothetical protein
MFKSNVLLIIFFSSSAFGQSKDALCELAIINTKLKFQERKESANIKRLEIPRVNHNVLHDLIVKHTNLKLKSIPSNDIIELKLNAQNAIRSDNQNSGLSYEKHVALSTTTGLYSKYQVCEGRGGFVTSSYTVCNEEKKKITTINVRSANRKKDKKYEYNESFDHDLFYDADKSIFYCLKEGKASQVSSPVDCVKNGAIKVQVVRIRTNQIYKQFKDGILKDKGPNFIETCAQIVELDQEGELLWKKHSYRVSIGKNLCYPHDLIQSQIGDTASDAQVETFLNSIKEEAVVMPKWSEFLEKNLHPDCHEICKINDNCKEMNISERSEIKIVPAKPNLIRESNSAASKQ